MKPALKNQLSRKFGATNYFISIADPDINIFVNPNRHFSCRYIEQNCGLYE